MLHNEARHLIVQALNHQIPVNEIAKYFSVNTSTIYRLRERLKATASEEMRTSLRGCKRSLSADDIFRIDRLIQQQPDITIHEVTDTLQLHVSNEMVRKAIVKLGYVYKKKSLQASEQDRPDVQQKRTNWQQCLLEKDTGHLVFLDESAANINMTKHYTQAQSNQRAIDSAPLNTPINTTILSSIRLDGRTCVYTIYQGGTTQNSFSNIWN